MITTVSELKKVLDEFNDSAEINIFDGGSGEYYNIIGVANNDKVSLYIEIVNQDNLMKTIKL